MRQMTVRLGESFEKASQSAKNIATEVGGIVEFRFNGVTVRVDGVTDLDHLYRDYLNQSYLGWQTIGPDCVPSYPPSLQSRLDMAKIEHQKLRDMQREEYLARTNHSLNSSKKDEN